MQGDSGGLTARAKAMLEEISGREQKLWFELVVDVLVGVYFYPKAFALMVRGDEALTGRAMTNLIMGTVTWAVLVSIGLTLLFRSQPTPEPKDERDRMIEITTGRWFGRVLVICMLAIIGLVVMQSIVANPGMLLFILTPLGISLLLLFSLLLASLVDSIAKLYCYRRGF